LKHGCARASKLSLSTPPAPQGSTRRPGSPRQSGRGSSRIGRSRSRLAIHAGRSRGRCQRRC